MSTGMYIRVKRDGVVDSIEIDQCTEAELIEHFQDKDKNQVVHWLVSALETLNAQIEQLSSGVPINRVET